MAQNNDNVDRIRTTTGDRLSTGAVNAVLSGGLTAATYAAITGVQKLFKIGNFKQSAYATRLSWSVAAGAAAVAGIWTFITADKRAEVAREIALSEYLNPANGSDAARSKRLDDDYARIDKGDLSILDTKLESSKFRDKVAASRAVAASKEIGG